MWSFISHIWILLEFVGFRVEFEQSGMGLGSVGACGWGLLMVSYVESDFLMLSGFSVVNILMMGFVNDGLLKHF